MARHMDPDGRMAWAIARLEYTAVVAIATRLGAASLGGAIGRGLFDLLHQEAADHQNASGEAQPGTKESDQGCIYCVKGDKTKSGKDYVGSTDNLDQRQRDKSDGRDREGAQVVDNYPKGDRDSRRAKEQQAINDRGGVEKLDNRRNEIAPNKWPSFGVTSPD